MKSRLSWFIAGLFSVGFISVVEVRAASPAPNAVDPVFGLSYQPAKVRFEAAPANLLSICPELENARWTRKLWIYAQTDGPHGRVLVVGGFYAARPPAARPPSALKLETDPKGAVIETTATGCTLLGPAREVFRYPDDLVPPTVLRALAADLVKRYRTAFGGAATLANALRHQHREPTGARDAVLRDALSAGN
jgi:hypothetical protein